MAMRDGRTAGPFVPSSPPEPEWRGARQRRSRWRKPRKASRPPGIRGRAILDGERAAWAGQYDEWSFVPEMRIAYLERLGSECEQAMATGHARSAGKLRTALSALRRNRRAARVAEVIAESRLQTARQRRTRARDREQVSLETLDLIAGSSFPQLPVPWFDEEEGDDEEAAIASQCPEHDEGRDGGRDPGDRPLQGSQQASGAVGSPRTATASLEPDAVGVPLLPPHPGQADWREPAQPGGWSGQREARTHPRWVGPANGRFAMLVPQPLAVGVLVLLAAVEIPIYYKIFSYFNGGNLTLTWTFTLPIALGMVLAPHLVGKLYRRRQEVPREPLTPFLTAFVMALWFAAGCLLGWLRQRVLLVPRIDPQTNKPVSLAGQLHVSWWAVTGVFASVLLLSGLIAFILGIGEPHPLVAGYHAAVRASEEAEEEYEAAVRAHAEAAEPVKETEDDVRAGHQAEADLREQALRAEYRAAAEAYLDTVGREMGDPNITQATSTALRDRPPRSHGPMPEI